MSTVKIRAALETRLLGMPGVVSQMVAENASFQPQMGTPYGLMHLLPASPDSSQLGRQYIERGIFQVLLKYPNDGTGPNAAQAQAELIRTYFARGTSVTNGGILTRVVKPATLAPAYLDGDRYTIPVSIQYEALVTY
jgi:hypothetical protein